MLTAENKTDLIAVLKDYRAALAAGDNDKIADTAEVLDTVVCAMELPDLDHNLAVEIFEVYEDEMDFDEAVAKIDAMLERLAS